MRLATLDNGTPDGALAVVSGDGERVLEIGAPAPTLIALMEDWDGGLAAVQSALVRLEAGEGAAPDKFCAPMPRSWQWLDGSAFDTHGKLMQIAFGLDPIETDRPLMYQGMSDRFYGPTDDISFISEEDGIDFEGEFGVIVDAVPMGTSATDALRHIRLIVQINDWSLRAIAPIEMKTGFGWVQAKPACSAAPFAVTPDELGEDWRDGRVCLDLNIRWNGEQFGKANGREMAFGFHELVAHAARTRDLVAGTIIGSGTVSNAAYAEVGSSCISERRAIEMIERENASTMFMSFGDEIEMRALSATRDEPFGRIRQRVVAR
ncbi:fumarylacetoacetate hydrolase family protein [Aurantiacibacter zhengii]|uniref:Fumarylacetoacetate hydrolase n=1 Tax=Aurantiacibacter zhengii TaxID=2307003 RepID=A0A418NUX1_9SPHN|nr:fumarylacetoacetate hydrolase family protein [Aurantiacibacter zhengii]RIV87734.1 fumarylacetoacetate hydrolase [Aurantiacibacter zhengii]